MNGHETSLVSLSPRSSSETQACAHDVYRRRQLIGGTLNPAGRIHIVQTRYCIGFSMLRPKSQRVMQRDDVCEPAPEALNARCISRQGSYLSVLP
jgi:hypothetical protein